MEQLTTPVVASVTFGHWALVMGVAFFVGVCTAAFLGWLLVEREGAPFNRNEVDNGRRDDD